MKWLFDDISFIDDSVILSGFLNVNTESLRDQHRRISADVGSWHVDDINYRLGQLWAFVLKSVINTSV